jgi:CheY-like chemotaxis protein
MVESPAVLIVEDEPVVLKVAGMALSTLGISFAKATDVPNALALLETTAFKVVLSDLKLPGASGFDILKRAKETSPPPQVIIISGYATIENTLRSFELGAFDFVPKPFDVEELTSVTERALRFAHQPTPTQASVPGERVCLGHHSWAHLDADGSATLGVGETVAGVMGELDAMECLQPGHHAVQGHYFCQLTAADGLTHRIWAPLSGRVISQNPVIAENLDLIQRAPYTEGWIARVIPSSLEKELPNLRQRHPSASS